MSITTAGPAPSALPELTPGRGLGTWHADPYAIVLILVLGGLYAWAAVRLARRGERWPVARTAVFALLGLGTITVATMSSLAVYDRTLFWPAAVQNILLDLIAPLGLALGDPLSLAQRALPPGAAAGLRRALRGRTVRFFTFPLVSTLFVLASELCIYFTPYFENALRHDAVHQVMYLQLLLAGGLFVLPMLSREELLPGWCGPPVRAVLVFVDGMVDAVPGIVVMTSGTLVAGDWYGRQHRGWGPSLRHDQVLGGGLMLTIAEMVGLPFLIAVFAEWVRSERGKTAELDRRLDRELAATAPPKTPAGSGTAGSGTVPEPELTRPWWETDEGVVGERFRQSRETG
jgi:cytochrome c oxidase assembly factor CtaG